MMAKSVKEDAAMASDETFDSVEDDDLWSDDEDDADLTPEELADAEEYLKLLEQNIAEMELLVREVEAERDELVDAVHDHAERDPVTGSYARNGGLQLGHVLLLDCIENPPAVGSILFVDCCQLTSTGNVDSAHTDALLVATTDALTPLLGEDDLPIRLDRTTLAWILPHKGEKDLSSHLSALQQSINELQSSRKTPLTIRVGAASAHKNELSDDDSVQHLIDKAIEQSHTLTGHMPAH